MKDNDIFHRLFLQSHKDAVQIRQSKGFGEIIHHLYDLAISLQIYRSSALMHDCFTFISIEAFAI